MSREGQEREADPAQWPELAAVLQDHVVDAGLVEDRIVVVLGAWIEYPEAGIDRQRDTPLGAGLGQLAQAPRIQDGARRVVRGRDVQSADAVQALEGVAAVHSRLVEWHDLYPAAPDQR